MLSNERKLEIYTERLWRLAMDLALQSSAGGKDYSGIAVVADETRNIANKLYRLLDEADNASTRDSIAEMLVQAQFLSFNGLLEMLRVFKTFSPADRISNPLAVILEEIRRAASDIGGLFGLAQTADTLPQPELKNESSISNFKLYLVQATIGGVAFVENTAYMQEIVAYIDGDEHFGIQDGFLKLRAQRIPVIDCYARFNLKRPTAIDHGGRKAAMIISTGWEKEATKYAVPIDALPLSFGFYSRFAEGQNVHSRSEVFADSFVRACWDTADGGQMLFLDWKALSK